MIYGSRTAEYKLMYTDIQTELKTEEITEKSSYHAMGAVYWFWVHYTTLQLWQPDKTQPSVQTVLRDHIKM